MRDYQFSVIIPAYNSERYLGETIESVLQQRKVTFEVIVVDDGSTDGTFEVAQSFGGCVKILSQPNSGCSSARNYGARAATGDYLAFLDADDIWLPEKLETQSHKLRAGYDMVYTNRFNIGDKGDLPSVQSDIEQMPEGDIFENLLMGNVITNSSVVIKRERFLSLNGFNTSLLTCEDWDLWLRYAASGSIGFCPEPLVKYRFHAGGKSRNYVRQAAARENIISSILATDRGSNISGPKKRRVWAYTFRSAAWASARARDMTFSMKQFVKAFRQAPFEFRIWYDAARVIFGRV